MEGAIIEITGKPSTVHVHKMTVGINSQSPAMEVTVEATGFGVTKEGEFQAIPANKDTSPYSARTFITAISRTSFKLNPGEKVPVEVTLSLPPEMGANTRYAAVYVSSSAVGGGGGVGQVFAVVVPVVITPMGALQNRTGIINQLLVKPVEAGKPIEILADVMNTGNRHFRVKGTATILDPKGQVVAELPMPLSPNSIIPTYSVQMKAQYSALDLRTGLPAGTYTARVTIFREDGSQVDSRETSFAVKGVYRPFPEISDQNLFIKCFVDEEPGRINARQKADLEINFTGTGKVTGCVAIGKYPQEPPGTPRFADPFDKGGIGLRSFKYLGIQVQGFDKGAANLTVVYRSNELNGTKPDDLYLALRQSSKWNRLQNLSVQKGSSVVNGDLDVRDLLNAPLIVLGSGDETTGGLDAFLANPIFPLVAGAVLAGILSVVILLLVLSRQRKNSGAAKLT